MNNKWFFQSYEGKYWLLFGPTTTLSTKQDLTPKQRHDNATVRLQVVDGGYADLNNMLDLLNSLG